LHVSPPAPLSPSFYLPTDSLSPPLPPSRPPSLHTCMRACVHMRTHSLPHGAWLWEIFGPFFPPQNILFPLKTYYMCVYIHIHIHIYVCEQRAEDLLYVLHQQLDQVFSS